MATYNSSSATGFFASVNIYGENAIAGSNNTSNAGLLYSTDGGKTWESSDVTEGEFITLSMDGLNAVAGSGSNGIKYSGDGGKTWTSAINTTDPVNPVAMTGRWNAVYIVGLNALAGSGSEKGAFFSIDGGASWKQSLDTTDSLNPIPLLGYVNAVYIDGINALAGSGSDKGSFYSTDRGATWKQSRFGGLLATGYINGVSIVGNNAVGASGSNLGVLYSIDKGINWIQANNKTDPINPVPMTGYFDFIYMVGTNAISGPTGMWNSIDSGASWSQSVNITGGGLLIDTIKTVYMVGTNAIAGSGSGTGLWHSLNGGVSWRQSNITTGSFNSVFTNSSLRSVAAGPGIYYSTPSSFVCFKEDTKILTNNGYIAVQDLRKGDLVKTLNHGYKAISMIGKREIYHECLEERIKDQLYKCTKESYPEIFEPLVMTGCHSILVEDFASEEQREKVIEVNGDTYLTDDKYRLPVCADERVSVYETAGIYAIYHMALENDDYYMNYGIYANGLLVETCSKRYLKELSNMALIE